MLDDYAPHKLPRYSHEIRCGCKDPQHLVDWVKKRIEDLRFGHEEWSDDQLKRIYQLHRDGTWSTKESKAE